jgi:hypothetical protein
MPPLFGRDQFRDVAHDLVSDLIQLPAVLLSMSLRSERTILKAGTKCGFKKRETKDLVRSGHDQTI